MSYKVYEVTHKTVLQPLFRDHPGEPVPEEEILWI